MKKLILTLSIAVFSILLFGQNENPFSQFGYEAPVMKEKTKIENEIGVFKIINTDSTSQIGWLIIDTKNSLISFYSNEGYLCAMDTINSSIMARWLTTDPANQYHSPYLGMGNNPINKLDPDGALDDWYVDNETGNVVCFVGVRGDIDGYTWLSSDNYAFGIDEIIVTPDRNYLGENIRMYNINDIIMRDKILNGPQSPITTFLNRQESNGIYDILTGKEYWDTYGHTVGNLILASYYINMADAVTSVDAQIPNTKSFSPKMPNYHNSNVKISASPILQPRAPRGGIEINGTFYKGGQFIPRN